MTPIDLLDKIIMGAYFSSMKRPVGWYIQKLPEDSKEIIKELKSDHIKNVRM